MLLAQNLEPFGNVLEQDGSGSSGFGYTGEQIDGTGLVYLRSRYYQPEVGRFLTADSIVPDPLRSVGWNRYAYVYNNPIRYTDPSGKNPLCFALIAIDGPFPVGDLACAALIAYTFYGIVTIAQHVDLPTSTPPGFNLLPKGAHTEPEIFPLPEQEKEVIPCGDPPSVPPYELPPFDVHFPTIDDIITIDERPPLVLSNVFEARRNAHLAGKNHPTTGIPFDQGGYPDFSSVSVANVKIEFTGSRKKDVRLANKAAGFDTTPEGYVWHHHQDGTTMQLVPRGIHRQTGHDGGFAGN